MCAISGILNHHSVADANRIIRAMTAAQTHRGPDEDGYFVDVDVAFGHRRLSVIDLASGQQPMDRGNGIVAILNGEIYNYQELRRDLEEHGHHFATLSDTEVLIHLYEEMGSEFIPLLSGMFAFAVYDRRRRRVLFARDRLGKKPLHYFMHKDGLVFASEICGLKEHPGMNKTLDLNALGDFLSLQYVPEPATVYRTIRRLPPGHLMEFQLDGGALSIRSYWHLEYSNKNGDLSFEDAGAQLRKLVEKAVAKRLVSDVPLGLFLSGGVDSAVVAATAARLRGENGVCNAYTIGVADPAYDERASARWAADCINRIPGANLITHERVVEPGSFELLQELVGNCGQPFADASIIPTTLLCRFAREEITVALSGDGADELFSGYERYIAMRIIRKASFLPERLRKILFGSIARLPGSGGERSFSGRLKRLCRLLATPSDRAYFALLDRCPWNVKKELFGEAWQNAATHDSAEVFEYLMPELSSPDPEERFAELDLKTYLPGDVLTKVDIASMSCGLEVRSPFLDHEIVEFAAQLPAEYKLCGNNRKRILKAAFSDVFPAEFLDQRKRGFGVPVASWLRGSWKEQAYNALFSSPLCSDDLLDPVCLKKLWSEHQSGKKDNSYLLWNLLALSLFLDR